LQHNAELVEVVTHRGLTGEGIDVEITLVAPEFLEAAGRSQEAAELGADRYLVFVVVRHHHGELDDAHAEHEHWGPFLKIDGKDIHVPSETRLLSDDGHNRTNAFIFEDVSVSILAVRLSGRVVTSSVDEKKVRVREFYAAMDRQDLDAVSEFVTPNYCMRFSGSPGLDFTAAKGMMGMFFAALPDLRHEILDLFGEGDRVAVRLRVVATHQGELMGVPATGKQVDFESSNVFRFDGDKIEEQWITADMLTMLKQIGAIPSPD
jgi:predicted ester cyclase